MDPEHGTELLWAPGRRGDLNLARIVDHAVAVADAEGLAAVSMRRVAERLGFTSMSLYRHVPGKAELVGLMRERVLGEWAPSGQGHVDGPPDTATDDDLPWRTAVEAWAREGMELHRRHPWLAEASGARQVPGPNAVAGFERALTAMARTGLPPAEVVAAVALVGDYVEGAAAQESERARAEQTSGLSHEEWWGERESLFEELDERYPTLNRLYAEGAYESPPDAFEYGLARVLDGIQTRVRDESRDESKGVAHTTECVECGRPVAYTGFGRPKDYCSPACRQRAYRSRRGPLSLRSAPGSGRSSGPSAPSTRA
ncbi:TetR/AcrR family transcriptional regulator [Nocardiopsis nanhaiensis]